MPLTSRRLCTIWQDHHRCTKQCCPVNFRYNHITNAFRNLRSRWSRTSSVNEHDSAHQRCMPRMCIRQLDSFPSPHANSNPCKGTVVYSVIFRVHRSTHLHILLQTDHQTAVRHTKDWTLLFSKPFSSHSLKFAPVSSKAPALKGKELTIDAR